jgi:predicted nucleotidyltransferase component of viral defense system
MLTYDSLIEYAKEKGMPEGKLRGILREYLQTLILKFMCRHELGRKIYFLGGTYLRFIHQFKRFSEDLAFNGKKFDKKEFEDQMNFVKVELSRENLNCKINFDYRGNLLTAKLIFGKDLLNAYQLIDQRGHLMIKVEIHQPPWRLKTEENVVNGFGEIFPVLAMTRGYIFCEKMLALSTHKRGRHVYDLIMMLSHKFPMDDYILKEQGIKKSALEYLKELFFSISDAELKKLSESVRPFLFEERETEYVSRAKLFVEKLI